MTSNDGPTPPAPTPIHKGVDLEDYARALGHMLKEVRALNRILEIRLKERTLQLQQAHEELAKGERLAVLGNLTATVSHELRNPLGALRTGLFMIQNKTKDLDLGLESTLVRADRSIDRCDKIITQMLDFARSSQMEAEETAIDQWLDGVLSEQELLDGVTVIRETGAPDVVVAFDPERLRRAVINVFENGCHAILDAMKESEVPKEHSMTVKTCAAGDRYEMRFSDTGKGMDLETLQKIFEPLFSTKSYGTGLGMPTVRQIMELHGGGIEIESAPGEGTTVILWLPIGGAKAEEAAA